MRHPIERYQASGSWLYLGSEAGALDAVTRLSQHGSSLSQEAAGWLAVQSAVHNAASAAFNGELAARRWSAPGIASRLAGRGMRGGFAPVTDSLVNAAGERLLSLLNASRPELRDVYGALQESEEILMSPPAGILTEKRLFPEGERLDSSVVHAVAFKIRDSLSPFEAHISAYLHGSMATGDYTAFSDVDDLIVVSRGTWDSFDRLSKAALALARLAAQYQRIDPLQHHGHWVYLETDLVCLDQSMMPLAALERGVRITGSGVISANVRTDRSGFPVGLWNIVQEVREQIRRLAEGGLGLFYLKDLVAGISLLPALTFQVGGTMIDKKSAIDRAPEKFSRDALKSLEWATATRLRWDEIASGYRTRAVFAASRLLPAGRILRERIARSAGSQSHVPADALPDADVVEATLKLTEEAVEHLSLALNEK